MNEIDIIIESEDMISDFLLKELSLENSQITTTRQTNMDGNLPTYFVFMVAGLDIVLKILDLYLKSDEFSRKVRNLTIEEKKINELTTKELKQLIEVYVKKRKK